MQVANAALIAGAVLACSTATAEIRLGRINDFEAPTSESWLNNIGTGRVIESGGPDGSGFMRITSTGPQGNDPSCPSTPINPARECGSRLAINNEGPQWTGDYLAAGVRSIQLAVRNAGQNQAALRLAFSKIRSSGVTWWITRTPIVLEPNGDWRTVTFSLEESALAKSPNGFGVDGADVYESAFASIAVARILVSRGLDHRGEQVAHTIDVDQISALATVPPREPLIHRDDFEAD